ncbi:MAG: hypothetical protein HC844_15960 [Tabrizicola sp.]|nr:hypothetical protein [Tabrizicola sp.]
MYRLAVALCLVSSASSAGTPLVPPSRFDHPYPGPMVIYQIDRANAWHECSGGGRFEARRDVAGCGVVHEGTCMIWVALKTKRAGVADILRHEVAHCNGWSGDHQH